VLFLVFMATEGRLGLSERLQHWLMLAFGLSIPIMVILLVYVKQNALASLIEVHILYPIKSYSNVEQLSFKTMASNFAYHVREQPMAEHLPIVTLAGILPFIVAGIWSLRKSSTSFATPRNTIGQEGSLEPRVAGQMPSANHSGDINRTRQIDLDIHRSDLRCSYF